MQSVFNNKIDETDLTL